MVLVEHINLISPKFYNNNYIVYLSIYSEKINLKEHDLVLSFKKIFKKINPDFKDDWIVKYKISRSQYAQPVHDIKFYRHPPTITTTIPGLYSASMGNIYPQDRGINYHIKLAQKTAKLITRKFNLL